MLNCCKCIFYDRNGYRDMGFSISQCKLKMVEEQRKKNNNKKYDLFNALILDESQATQCPYFTFVCDVVDLIKGRNLQF